MARKSIVLLKNEGGLLPLDKAAKTIAVIGPLAADKDTPLGNWRAQAVAGSAVSLLEGIQAAVPSTTRVVHAEGVKLVTGPRNFMARSVINTTDRSGIPAAVEAARAADVVVLAVGEDAFQSGEGRSQVDIGFKGLQEELMQGGARGEQEGGRRAHDRAAARPGLDGREPSPPSSRRGTAARRRATRSPTCCSASTTPRASCRSRSRATSARCR